MQFAKLGVRVSYVESFTPETVSAYRAVVWLNTTGNVLNQAQGDAELENVVALARAEVALGRDDAVDPLLAQAAKELDS